MFDFEACIVKKGAHLVMQRIKNDPTPIVIFQMGKVGSFSVYKTLQLESPFNNIFHVHYLTPKGISQIKINNQNPPSHLVQSKILRKMLMLKLMDY